jgi:predicted nucleic acid-binding protein
MTSVVSDASVVVKLLTPEQDSDRADLLIRRHDLVAPELLLAELGNTIWSRVHGGLDMDIAADLLASALDLPLDLRSIRPLMARALAIAAAAHHPVYDCIYLALAESLDIPLVTADQRFLGALHRASLQTVAVTALADFG